ncbi:hypothetical protein Tco_1417872 [Tanacetum coccineum]
MRRGVGWDRGGGWGGKWVGNGADGRGIIAAGVGARRAGAGGELAEGRWRRASDLGWGEIANVEWEWVSVASWYSEAVGDVGAGWVGWMFTKVLMRGLWGGVIGWCLILDWVVTRFRDDGIGGSGWGREDVWLKTWKFKHELDDEDIFNVCGQSHGRDGGYEWRLRLGVDERKIGTGGLGGCAVLNRKVAAFGIGLALSIVSNWKIGGLRAYDRFVRLINDAKELEVRVWGGVRSLGTDRFTDFKGCLIGSGEMRRWISVGGIGRYRVKFVREGNEGDDDVKDVEIEREDEEVGGVGNRAYEAGKEIVEKGDKERSLEGGMAWLRGERWRCKLGSKGYEGIGDNGECGGGHGWSRGLEKRLQMVMVMSAVEYGD